MLNEIKRGIKNRVEYSTKGMKDMFTNIYDISKIGGYEQYLNNIIKLSDINNDGVIKIYDDKIIKASGTIGACTGMFNIEGKKVPVIIIEKKYKGTEIEAPLYYHELGHVNNELRNKTTNARIYTDELRADFYAVNIVGAQKFIKALKALRKESFGYCTKEIDMRIAEITVKYGLNW